MSDHHEDELIRNITRAHDLDTTAHERARASDPLGAAQAWTDSAAALREGAAVVVLRLARTLERSAGALLHAGQTDRGVALAQEAVNLLRGARSGGILSMLVASMSLGNLGMLLCAMRQFEDASSVLAETEELAAQVAEGPPPALLAHLQRMGALGSALHFTGRPANAAEVLGRAVECGTAAAQRNDSLTLNLEIAQLLNTQGQIFLATGQANAALPGMLRCVVMLRALVVTDNSPATRNLLAAALNRLGHAYAALKRDDDALVCLEESVGLMRELVEEEGCEGLSDDLRAATEDLDRFRRSTSMAIG